MNTPRIALRFDPDVVARVDKASALAGLTRTEFIRRAIDLTLKMDPKVYRTIGIQGVDDRGTLKKGMAVGNGGPPTHAPPPAIVPPRTSGKRSYAPIPKTPRKR